MGNLVIIKRTGQALAGFWFLALASQLPTLGQPAASFQWLPVSQAQAAGDNVRRTPAMRQNIYKRFSRIRELADAGKLDTAFGAVADLKEMDLNSYERAMMFNLEAFLHFQEKDYAGAAEAYKNLLKQPNLPLSLEQDTWYSLAKLRSVLEDYEGALKALDQWFALVEEPGAEAHVMKSQLLFQQENYKAALDSVSTAVAMKRKAGEAVPENWYLLQRGAYYQLEDYQGLRRVLEVLVKEYPKKDYLVQLAAVYGELDMEEKQLAVKEAAYEKGYLDKETSLVSFAQQLRLHENYFKAAQVMARGIEAGIIEPDADNLRQLGDSWLLAKEYDKALSALGRAAKKSEDGELYLRMAQVAVDLGRWQAATDYASQAIEKGGFDKLGMAHIVNGLALFNLDKLPEARAAFRKAREFEQSRSMAQQWDQFVEQEQERRRKLEAASRPLTQEASSKG